MREMRAGDSQSVEASAWRNEVADGWALNKIRNAEFVGGEARGTAVS